MQRVKTRWIVLGVLLVLIAAGWWAITPNAQQRAEATERQRVYCLDHFCEGDVEPKHDWAKEATVKLNGQWFIGPSEYFARSSGAVFYWPGRSPGFAPGDFPPGVKGKDFSEVAIEIFLRHHDGIMYGPNRYPRLLQAEAQGRLISKSMPRPGLEVWRIKETDGARPAVWYVATAYVDKDPNGSVLACFDSGLDFCTTAFRWQPGIAADMRFSAKHGPDWPEIYQEANRILQLLKKV